jgi:hypothetical protein
MDLGEIWKFLVGKLGWMITLVAIWNWPWHF